MAIIAMKLERWKRKCRGVFYLENEKDGKGTAETQSTQRFGEKKAKAPDFIGGLLSS
jgi:hypothetical protein